MSNSASSGSAPTPDTAPQPEASAAREPVIGVIGGMGPYAGLDLVRKIFDQTEASADQDHVPVALHSFPHRICDRSTFLFDPSKPSPVPALTEVARSLVRAGATVAGMPCNTAHARPIFDAMVATLRDEGHGVRLLHMIQETVGFIRDAHPDIERVGLLSTLAVYRLRVYQDPLEAAGLEAVLPDEAIQEGIVNRTIFDKEHGIKAKSNPVTPFARQSLLSAIEHLHQKGAQAVILGCTELPLAITERQIEGMLILDPTVVLARALVRATYPEKLKPLPGSADASDASPQPAPNGQLVRKGQGRMVGDAA